MTETIYPTQFGASSNKKSTSETNLILNHINSLSNLSRPTRMLRKARSSVYEGMKADRVGSYRQSYRLIYSGQARWLSYIFCREVQLGVDEFDVRRRHRLQTLTLTYLLTFFSVLWKLSYASLNADIMRYYFLYFTFFIPILWTGILLIGIIEYVPCAQSSNWQIHCYAKDIFEPKGQRPGK